MKLDGLDYRLLSLLQRDAWMTADEMAAVIPLSPSAIQRRVKRLRETRVVTGAVAVVDPAKVGSPTFFVVSLEVERERPELINTLCRWISERDKIQQAFYATGQSDFILIITAKSADEYDQFMAELVSDNSNVRRYTTNVVLRSLKRGINIPV